jgi:hypothetical protein
VYNMRNLVEKQHFSNSIAPAQSQSGSLEPNKRLVAPFFVCIYKRRSKDCYTYVHLYICVSKHKLRKSNLFDIGKISIQLRITHIYCKMYFDNVHILPVAVYFSIM